MTLLGDRKENTKKRRCGFGHTKSRNWEEFKLPVSWIFIIELQLSSSAFVSSQFAFTPPEKRTPRGCSSVTNFGEWSESAGFTVAHHHHHPRLSHNKV